MKKRKTEKKTTQSPRVHRDKAERQKTIGTADERKDFSGPDARFAPVVEAFAGVRGVSAGKLFASYGLKVDGKIFAMFGRGRLVVKLPKERVDELMSAKKAERFDPGHGRLMKEWVAFKDGEDQWVELSQEACEFVKKGLL